MRQLLPAIPTTIMEELLVTDVPMDERDQRPQSGLTNPGSPTNGVITSEL